MKNRCGMAGDVSLVAHGSSQDELKTATTITDHMAGRRRKDVICKLNLSYGRVPEGLSEKKSPTHPVSAPKTPHPVSNTLVQVLLDVTSC